MSNNSNKPPKPSHFPQRPGNILPRQPSPDPPTGADEDSLNQTSVATNQQAMITAANPVSRGRKSSDPDLFSQHADLGLPPPPAKRVSLSTIPQASQASDWFAGSAEAYRNNRQAEAYALMRLQSEARASSAPAIGKSNLRRDDEGAMLIEDALPSGGRGEAIANHQAHQAPVQACVPAAASVPFVAAGQTQAGGHTLPFLVVGGPKKPADPPAPFLYEKAIASNHYQDERKPAAKPGPSPVAAKPETELPSVQGETTTIMLGLEEDVNWLSDFHCFVRQELVEVCFASMEDIRFRVNMNHKVVVSINQVGLRCRCCSEHGTLYDEKRAPRSVAFPSTISQIYQSLTMMIREHLSRCGNIPQLMKEKFVALKQGKSAHKGTVNSKLYWEYSACRLGMVDSDRGIILTEESQSSAKNLAPFGSTMTTKLEAPVMLVGGDDKAVAKADYTFTLLQQVQLVRLLPEECVGNRSTLQSGSPGMGCVHCCKVGWMGLCRVFPLKRRKLREKLEDMYQHLMRCSRCPNHLKELLQSQRSRGMQEDEKALYGLVWERLTRNKA